MTNVPILVCSCGMRLKAPGAVPGRVGKCPACGGILRVPDGGQTGTGPRADAPRDPLPSAPPQGPSTFSVRRTRPKSRADRQRGLRVPTALETRYRQSLLYPLWGETGIALLILLPPLLWITSIPLVSGVYAATSGNFPSRMASALILLPTALVLFPAAGYSLLYLGRVLVSSAVGEIDHPRWPEWDPVDMARGFGRWIWALLAGVVIGGLPATAYWMYCGDVDPIDALILTELVALGNVYAQIALLASILHDDPLGAHPVTVARALWRLRWRAVPPALVSGAFLVSAYAALVAVLEIPTPALAALAYWVFWIYLLYGGMVVLRILGLFYHRHARLLGWFRDRPRWGA